MPSAPLQIGCPNPWRSPCLYPMLVSDYGRPHAHFRSTSALLTWSKQQQKYVSVFTVMPMRMAMSRAWCGYVCPVYACKFVCIGEVAACQAFGAPLFLHLTLRTSEFMCFDTYTCTMVFTCSTWAVTTMCFLRGT